MADNNILTGSPEQMAIIGQVVTSMLQNEKQDKRARFQHLNKFAKKGQIVFAGSSLMEQFPIYEFLMDYDLPYTIYNRGIGGYTTQEMLESMHECVYDLEPGAVFLNIGTNDLNDKDYDPESFLARYEAVVQGIREHCPDAKLFLLAFYPVNQNAMTNPFTKEAFRARTNARIQEANAGVKALAPKHGARYLDLNVGITDADGNLKMEFVIDGVHMYADGYAEVLKQLNPVLKELCK